MLLENDIDIINNLHCDFFGKGISSVDSSAGPLFGRPYGGLAVLWRKSLGAPCIKFNEIINSRIMHFVFNSSVDIFNVYFPTEYRTEESYLEYVNCLGFLDAQLDLLVNNKVTIMGDFNASPGDYRHFHDLNNVCTDNCLILYDIENLPNSSYTYVSPAHHTVSWLDHCFISDSIDMVDCKIDYDSSIIDHLPLCVSFNCDISNTNCPDDPSYSTDSHHIRWCDATPEQLHNYSKIVDERLRQPNVNLSCFSGNCNNENHNHYIDVMYNDIVSILRESALDVIPSSEISCKSRIVPGWNDYVKELYTEARHDF